MNYRKYTLVSIFAVYDNQENLELIKKMEAEPGVEPRYTDLQSAA